MTQIQAQTATALIAADVWRMSYPDFVALIDQENTPPGAEQTLDWWREAASIEAGSHLLDLASSTGFSSRRLSEISGCSAAGVDISAPAVAAAQARAVMAGLSGRLTYSLAKAEDLPFSEATFTHVVAGCCFGFIADRNGALAESARVLARCGLLCVSSFAYERQPPDSLLDRVEACVGYRPEPQRDEAYWRRFFGQRFVLEAESPYPLPVYTQEEVCSAAADYLIRIAKRFDALEDATFDAIVKRLARDRLVFNEHRRYQSCTRFVWRRRDDA